MSPHRRASRPQNKRQRRHALLPPRSPHDRRGSSAVHSPRYCANGWRQNSASTCASCCPRTTSCSWPSSWDWTRRWWWWSFASRRPFGGYADERCEQACGDGRRSYSYGRKAGGGKIDVLCSRWSSCNLLKLCPSFLIARSVSKKNHIILLRALRHWRATQAATSATSRRLPQAQFKQSLKTQQRRPHTTTRVR